MHSFFSLMTGYENTAVTIAHACSVVPVSQLDLKALCKERGIVGYSKLAKAILIEKLAASPHISSRTSTEQSGVSHDCLDTSSIDRNVVEHAVIDANHGGEVSGTQPSRAHVVGQLRSPQTPPSSSNLSVLQCISDPPSPTSQETSQYYVPSKHPVHTAAPLGRKRVKFSLPSQHHVAPEHNPIQTLQHIVVEPTDGVFKVPAMDRVLLRVGLTVSQRKQRQLVASNR